MFLGKKPIIYRYSKAILILVTLYGKGHKDVSPKTLIEYRQGFFFYIKEQNVQLSVKDLSRLLDVPEGDIYRWIKEESIPFYRVHDQYRFNRLEILDWATAHKIKISWRILQDTASQDQSFATLTEMIHKGGIHDGVEGKDKKTLLTNAVRLLKLPSNIDQESLLSAILAREELGSTGFGDGIAIPHARYPIVTHIPGAIASVCFAKTPVDFGSMDGKPVHCLFTLVSPTVRSHLQALSRIAFVLRNAHVRDVLAHPRSPEVVLAAIAEAEKAIGKPA